MKIKQLYAKYMLIGLAVAMVAYFVATIITGIHRKTKKYTLLYKDRVIKKIIENNFINLEYEPEMGMSRNIYAQGQYEYYDRYTLDDYMRAKIDEKYKVEMEKSINSNLDIYPDKTELFFKKNKITMDSSEFEKYFDVKTTNKIVAMQLLTSEVMEELISFLKINNMKYDIKIRENIMYIRFYCGKMFETGKLRDGIVDKKLLERYYNILNFTYTLPKKIIKLIENTEL